MATLVTMARTKATAVWLGLVCATLASALAAGNHGITNHRAAGVVVLLVAFAKVRFVGLYFMDLRHAPRGLQLAFEGYCLMVLAAILGFYLV